MADDVKAGIERLANRLVPGADRCQSRRLSGGASLETWAFDVSGGTDCQSFVLRRAAPGAIIHPLTAGFAGEAEAIAAARSNGVPCPQVRLMLSPADGLGTGFVSEFIGGETLPRRIQRDEKFHGVRDGLVTNFGKILAAIHGASTDGIGALRIAGIADTLRLMSDALDADPVPRPVFEMALAWARRHAPDEPDRLCLVHGDFRLGNVIVSPDGVQAVLDWEMAHIGDPMQDLGWLCIPPWRFGRIDKPVAGLGSRAQLFDAYAAATGAKVDHARAHWWEVVGSLRWGLFCAEMLERFEGDDPSVERGMIVRRISESELDLMVAIERETADV